MVRYTHFESSDDVAAFAADGHHVRCLGTRAAQGGKETPARLECDGAGEWIGGAVAWCGAALFFAARELCRVGVRLVILVMGALVLPLAYELACIGGALLMYPLGAVGRWMATSVEHAGLALSERSQALCIGRRVLGALRGQAGRVSKRSDELVVSNSTALALRGGDSAEVES